MTVCGTEGKKPLERPRMREHDNIKRVCAPVCRSIALKVMYNSSITFYPIIATHPRQFNK
jgi:hypothetical protein